MTKAEKQASSARAVRNACREALRTGFTLMSSIGIGMGIGCLLRLGKTYFLPAALLLATLLFSLRWLFISPKKALQ